MVKLSEKIVDLIEFHAEQAYPEECCGMILGYSKNDMQVLEDVVWMENKQDENRSRRFFISPEHYKRAEELAEKRKMDLLGFYHSHPDHPSMPSKFDTDHALPWFTYIILSVDHGRAAATTAWLLNEDRSRFVEQKIILETTPVLNRVSSGVISFQR